MERQILFQFFFPFSILVDVALNLTRLRKLKRKLKGCQRNLMKLKCGNCDPVPFPFPLKRGLYYPLKKCCSESL